MDGDGEKVFGSGVVELLRKIEETGSLNRAGPLDGSGLQ